MKRAQNFYYIKEKRRKQNLKMEAKMDKKISLLLWESPSYKIESNEAICQGKG